MVSVALSPRRAITSPYDKLVEGIVLAVSRRPSRRTRLLRRDELLLPQGQPGRLRRAAQLAVLLDAQTTTGKPDGKALAFAHAFLGVSLQCAQCHKHPYDQWTKQDFDQFAAFFNGVTSREANRQQVKEMKAASA